jgi:hypothetical protein
MSTENAILKTLCDLVKQRVPLGVHSCSSASVSKFALAKNVADENKFPPHKKFKVGQTGTTVEIKSSIICNKLVKRHV